ncbi:SlyX family protein [Crenobacter sp. SG2303]|uniref:SlyX family protein n=1 Tax=Crenobacter oryzisoli TaxID=3056844 RepID=A0ABT7XT81_9NEIS|nr:MULTISPECIES: SlyX family protein [unclassified Crenobacter]MDN0076749.1 SlyX family protein [Crenobacter sp. SG2303]MDN0085033.1 SlyX family protein [Crenobacter sp. SG2305]
MEARLIELESKVALQDDLLDALNLTVARQQQQIDLLQQQLRVLYQQFRANQPDSDGGSGSLRDEIPPHY